MITFTANIWFLKNKDLRTLLVKHQVKADFLSYTIVDAQGKQLLKVEVKSGNPIELTITPIDPTVSPQVIEEAKQDIIISNSNIQRKHKKSHSLFCLERRRRNNSRSIPKT